MARALLAIQRYFGTRSDTRVGCVRLLHFSWLRRLASSHFR